MPDLHDDLPIKNSDEDKLGYGPFAKTVAECIRGINRPYGNVIAIHGPWGVGKSSLVELIQRELENLASEEPGNDLIVISFNSWCYRTEEGVIAGFFKEFHSGLIKNDEKNNDHGDKVVQERLKNLAAAIGVSSILYASDIEVDPTVSKGIIDTICGWFRKKEIQKGSESIEFLQQKIGDELKNLKHKILIIIDDVDRLSLEEVIAIFRLIKSVGKIENVIYLLSYDRDVAERIIKQKYYCEGSHYLEKIVQASFDLPNPRKKDLVAMLEGRLKNIFGDLSLNHRSMMNDRIRKIVFPEIKTPRDVHRLANVISVTYPAVQLDVDFGDFISVETIRIFHPNIYKEIRSLKYSLTVPRGQLSNEDNVLDRIKTSCKDSNANFDKIMDMLKLLFPNINDNRSVVERARSINDGTQKKRIYSPLHFDTYFRFSVSEDIVSTAEFQEFVGNVSNKIFVEKKLDRIKNPDTAYDPEKVAFLLDKMSYDIDHFRSDDISPFLITLYDIENNFSLRDRLSIVELTTKLILDRRHDIDVLNTVQAICDIAPLDMLLELCSWIYLNRCPEQDEEFGEERDLLENEDVEKIRDATLRKIRSAFADDSILDYNRIFLILLRWEDITNREDEISRMTKDMLNRSEGNVAKVANQLVGLFKNRSDDIVQVRFRMLNRLIDAEHLVGKLFDFAEGSESSSGDRDAARSLGNLLQPYVQKEEEEKDNDECPF